MTIDPRTEMDAREAREILDKAHAAWSRGDLEGVLAQYADDLTYWSNVGGADGAPLTIVGKADFAASLASITDVAEGTSVSEWFRYSDGVGRTKVEHYVRHKQTSLTLSGSYRQIITFRNRKILRLGEYHDAAQMAAFWRLILDQQR